MRRQLFKISSLLAALWLGTNAYGLNEPKHSMVDISSQINATQLEVTFKVSAKEGHELTFEAPWKLELKPAEGLTFAKSSFVKSEMDEKLPGFKVISQAPPSKAQGDIEYKLITFVCTTNKTACYREIHEGKHSWKQ